MSEEKHFCECCGKEIVPAEENASHSCPFCGDDMVIIGKGPDSTFWACVNNNCSSHSGFDFKKNDSKPFDFEQYKKFRKRCKKRSKR